MPRAYEFGSFAVNGSCRESGPRTLFKIGFVDPAVPIHGVFATKTRRDDVAQPGMNPLVVSLPVVADRLWIGRASGWLHGNPPLNVVLSNADESRPNPADSLATSAARDAAG